MRFAFEPAAVQTVQFFARHSILLPSLETCVEMVDKLADALLEPGRWKNIYAQYSLVFPEEISALLPEYFSFEITETVYSYP